MSQKTLEKVLEHLLNHEQDAAGELLHNYFVEKGRGIYESMMDDDHHHMGGNAGEGMVDEISTDMHGMHEEGDLPAWGRSR